MREIRLSGSEGGGAKSIVTPYPYRFHQEQLQLLHCRTLRALGVLGSRDPGVPLRSTPGFMLLPATRVLKRHVLMT